MQLMRFCNNVSFGMQFLFYDEINYSVIISVIENNDVFDL